MSKPSLQDMMTKRTPLAQRDVVLPANLYTKPQVDKPAYPRVDKPAKPLVEKYTTHLRPETIKAIKLLALEQDSKDYEVVQRALDVYLHGGGEQAAAGSAD